MSNSSSISSRFRRRSVTMTNGTGVTSLDAGNQGKALATSDSSTASYSSGANSKSKGSTIGAVTPSISETAIAAKKFTKKVTQNVLKSPFSPPSLGMTDHMSARAKSTPPISVTDANSGATFRPVLSTSNSNMRIPIGSIGTTSTSRQDEIRDRLIARMDEYSDEESLNVRCVSWNVNGQEPDIPQISAWLLGTATSDKPDVLAIGLQEVIVVDAASTVAYLASQEARQRRVELHARWVARVVDGLGKEYSLIKSESLVGMAIMVFTKKKLVQFVDGVRTDYRGTGPLGAGNKGAVAVRFVVNDLAIAFVNSHLAAHFNASSRRNEEQRLLARTLFSSDTRHMRKSDAERSDESHPSPPSPFENGTGVDDGAPASPLHAHHDVVLWFGDLNYRIEGASRAAVVKHIEANRLAPLLAGDQLSTARTAGEAFVGYKESDVTFTPTYKFDVGTFQFDSSEKQRIPSWTDRVLWRVNEAPIDAVPSLASPRMITSHAIPLRASDEYPRPISIQVEPVSYTSHMFLGSDHLPISAQVAIQYRSVDGAARAQVREDAAGEIRRNADNRANASLPHCEVTLNHVSLHPDGGSIEKVTVTNDGEVKARLEFVPLPDSEPGTLAIPEWLSIAPTQLALDPGTSAVLTFSLKERAVVSGTKQESILILHLDGGPDIFMFAAVEEGAAATCDVDVEAEKVSSLLHVSRDAAKRALDSLSPGERETILTFAMNAVQPADLKK